MNEYDRQVALFNAKTKNPDKTFYAHSVMKAENPDGDIYWFLTSDDEIIMVDMLHEPPIQMKELE